MTPDVNDYFNDIDYFDYFLYAPKTVASNPETSRTTCDPKPQPYTYMPYFL